MTSSRLRLFSICLTTKLFIKHLHYFLFSKISNIGKKRIRQLSSVFSLIGVKINERKSSKTRIEGVLLRGNLTIFPLSLIKHVRTTVFHHHLSVSSKQLFD